MGEIAKDITVTKTFFPPLEEYHVQLNRIWENQWLTNRGELVRELEEKISNTLGVSNVLAMTNGTLPIQIALNLFGDEGEIITTPFSYVATTSSIVWEKCTPVFVDIHPDYLTIDETKIEAAITSKTTAILATHVYGNPCETLMIEKIAKKHNLKVIYDAAHCFGVTYNGTSVFNYGDVSTCSFHATKLFHCGEGGAIFCTEKNTFRELFYRHNFGHKGKVDFHGAGINAKMSELHAAMGLSVLPHLDKIIKERKRVVDFYSKELDKNCLRELSIRENTEWNYSYYPVIFESEEAMLKTEKKLAEKKVYPRRYFYPSLNSLPFVDRCKMPVSDDLAPRVLCLPLYYGLSSLELQMITKTINDSLK